MATPTRRAVLGASLGLLAVPAVAAGNWQMVTEYPATAMPGEGVATFAAAVKRLTDGGMLVEPVFDGMRSAAMLDAVAENRVQAADAFTGALAGAAPIFQLSALPFLTGSGADTMRLLVAARPSYETALSARGLSLLYATPWPASGIWSRRPLDGPDSLSGLRIRTYDAASTAVFRAVGASPEQVSFADAMPRLRSGELDAVLSSGDGGAGARLWEMLPNFAVLDYASPLSLAFCGTATLASLSGEHRATIARAAGETEARQFTVATTRARENSDRMRNNGVRIASPSGLREKLVAASGSIIAAWQERAGDEGRRVLAAFRGG